MVIKKQDNMSMTSRKVNISMFLRMESSWSSSMKMEWDKDVEHSDIMRLNYYLYSNIIII